jgi:hypothetical protein
VELQENLKNLCLIEDPQARVVTLALDVSQAKPPHPEARSHQKNRLLNWMGSNEHPKVTREILWGVSGRISLFIEKEVKPETEGLFLVAGPGIWQPFELGVRITDFTYVGQTPYLAPLLEALTRMPRAYVFSYDQEEGVLEEVSMGVRREIERIPSAVVERDGQHQMTRHSIRSQAGSGRSSTRTGGGGRDRFLNRVEHAVESMLHKAADKVLTLQKGAPSKSIYAFGDRKHFPYFRDRLPVGLRSQAIHVGPVPHRHDALLAESIREQQDLRVRNRVEQDISDFQARRAEQCHVASGPEVILPLLHTGNVARVFLDPQEPLPGTKCAACGQYAGEGKDPCEACGHALAGTSMTQEVIRYALLHPSVSLTFVPHGESWLEDLGGMAALLTAEDIHSRV